MSHFKCVFLYRHRYDTDWLLRYVEVDDTHIPSNSAAILIY